MHFFVVNGIHRVVFFAKFRQNGLVGTNVKVERFAHYRSVVQPNCCYLYNVVAVHIKPRCLRIEHNDVAISIVLQEVGSVVAARIQQEVGWRERKLSEFEHKTACKRFRIEHLQPFQQERPRQNVLLVV